MKEAFLPRPSKPVPCSLFPVPSTHPSTHPSTLRSGFTIIELLVASLLLGLLVTILTMVFNQSSIAWRTGIAGTVNMDAVRENIAELREEADNAFIYDKKLYRLTGLWDKNGDLRDRACDAPGSTDEEDNKAILIGGSSRSGDGKWIDSLSNLEPDGFKAAQIGSSSSATSVKNYTVNVKSAGPNKKFDDYDDIWSFPDEFD